MLNIGCGLSIGNAKGIQPASSWPSVSDIPPGMVVRDADGVVKVKRRVFNNAGADWVDCGRPSWLSQLRPGIDSFFIDVVYLIFSYSAIGRVYSLEGASGTETQFSLIPTTNSAATYTRIGGTGTINIGAVPINTFVRHTLAGKVPSATSQSVLNNSKPVAITSGGTFISPNRLILGGYSLDPSTQNIEGQIAYFSIRDGVGNLIDALDFNNWDGSSSISFRSGHPCSVSDGAPVGAQVEALVPVSKL